MRASVGLSAVGRFVLVLILVAPATIGPQRLASGGDTPAVSVPVFDRPVLRNFEQFEERLLDRIGAARTPERREMILTEGGYRYWELLTDQAPTAARRLAGPILESALQRGRLPRRLRGLVGLTLGMHLRQQSESRPLSAVREAARLADAAAEQFRRVVAEAGDLKAPGHRETFAALAGPDADAQDRLGIGRMAPEIEGQDADGRALRLSDYRGRVVLLSFWGDW